MLRLHKQQTAVLLNQYEFQTIDWALYKQRSFSILVPTEKQLTTTIFATYKAGHGKTTSLERMRLPNVRITIPANSRLIFAPLKKFEGFFVASLDALDIPRPEHVAAQWLAVNPAETYWRGILEQLHTYIPQATSASA